LIAIETAAEADVQIVRPYILRIAIRVKSILEFDDVHTRVSIATVSIAVSLMLTLLQSDWPGIDLLWWIKELIKKIPIKQENESMNRILNKILALYSASKTAMRAFGFEQAELLLTILSSPERRYESFCLEPGSLRRIASVHEELGQLNPKTMQILSSSFLDEATRERYLARAATARGYSGTSNSPGTPADGKIDRG
jgi:hypothetical protein